MPDDRSIPLKLKEKRLSNIFETTWQHFVWRCSAGTDCIAHDGAQTSKPETHSLRQCRIAFRVTLIGANGGEGMSLCRRAFTSAKASKSPAQNGFID